MCEFLHFKVSDCSLMRWAVGHPQKFVRGDGVLFAERANELILCGKHKLLCRICIVKASYNQRNKSHGLDPKPGELRMSRVNPE